MSCTHPVKVWWSRKLNDHGNHFIVFTASESDGRPPFKVGCQQCTNCRISKGSDWAIRLSQEAKFHIESSFITLTYDDLHLPEHHTLVKRDGQLFMKRLRRYLAKRSPGLKVRYFLVGEYGENTHRPHYHLILFGFAFTHDRRPHSKKGGHQLYTSKSLDEIWGNGFCSLGSVTPDSCGYVAQYSFKKINGKRADEHYRRVDLVTGETYLLQKEFASMSTHPGIGYRHYDNYANQMFIRDSVIVKGREAPVPKYYDRCLKRDDPGRHKAIKESRANEAWHHRDEQTPERLAVKEEITNAKRKEHLNRKL
jgi:hypothetical protein